MEDPVGYLHKKGRQGVYTPRKKTLDGGHTHITLRIMPASSRPRLRHCDIRGNLNAGAPEATRPYSFTKLQTQLSPRNDCDWPGCHHLDAMKTLDR